MRKEEVREEMRTTNQPRRKMKFGLARMSELLDWQIQAPNIGRRRERWENEILDFVLTSAPEDTNKSDNKQRRVNMRWRSIFWFCVDSCWDSFFIRFFSSCISCFLSSSFSPSFISQPVRSQIEKRSQRWQQHQERIEPKDDNETNRNQESKRAGEDDCLQRLTHRQKNSMLPLPQQFWLEWIHASVAFAGLEPLQWQDQN